MALPSIPQVRPVTTRPAELSIETRIEIIASVIACVLHDAHEMQHGIPHTPFGRVDAESRRIYEAIGRQAATVILKPSRIREAKRKAAADALAIMGAYDEEDEEDQRRVPLDVRQARVTAAVESALHRYHVELAREDVGRG